MNSNNNSKKLRKPYKKVKKIMIFYVKLIEKLNRQTFYLKIKWTKINLFISKRLKMPIKVEDSLKIVIYRRLMLKTRSLKNLIVVVA